MTKIYTPHIDRELCYTSCYRRIVACKDKEILIPSYAEEKLFVCPLLKWGKYNYALFYYLHNRAHQVLCRAGCCFYLTAFVFFFLPHALDCSLNLTCG